MAMYSNSSALRDGGMVIPHFTQKFQLENGQIGAMAITDIFINSSTVAQERAKSEFLKNGYKSRWVDLRTYRTDFDLNDVIIVRGLPYLIKSISTVSTSVSTMSNIRGVRYEF